MKQVKCIFCGGEIKFMEEKEYGLRFRCLVCKKGMILRKDSSLDKKLGDFEELKQETKLQKEIQSKM